MQTERKVDEFDFLAQSIEERGILPPAARRLFLEAVKNKRGDHWRLCLAAFHVVGLRDGSTERLAHEADSSVDSIEDYSRTYRLYRAIRFRYDRLRRLGIGRDPKHAKVYEKGFNQVLTDLADLRRELHYTKWLIVANAVYTGFRTPNGRRRLTIPEAFDALKSGADGNTESFAAFVQGSEITQEKAMRKAHKALSQVLSYPMPKRKRAKLKAAFMVIDLEVSNGSGKTRKR